MLLLLTVPCVYNQLEQLEDSVDTSFDKNDIYLDYNILSTVAFSFKKVLEMNSVDQHYLHKTSKLAATDAKIIYTLPCFTSI